MATRCDRISTGHDERSTPRVERDGDVWHIRSAETARQILRERDATTQAGFTAEAILDNIKEAPILFMDGEPHRKQRAKVARYFAPKTVATRYRDLIATRVDALMDAMIAAETVTLDKITLRLSVDVASQVIGLTESDMDAMARRLERFFDQPRFDLTQPGLGRSRFQTLRAALTGNLPVFWFYARDVRPAIRERRRERQEDVISHLIDEGYSDAGIVMECITYGAAGMVTTREFISMCVLHFLRNDALRGRFVVAEEAERMAILGEILRLEPVVGHLYRRTQRELEVSDGDTTHTIPAGALLDLALRQTNADPRIVGEEPDAVCPGRDLPRGYGAEMMSFGDGAHKCPGNALALQETDLFLRRLFSHRVRLVQEPRLEWDEIVAGYALRDFEIAVDA